MQNGVSHKPQFQNSVASARFCMQTLTMRHGDIVFGLRELLLEGDIPPGARIPERELCARFQVSRTPLREALKVLAAEGLVLLLPNRGARAAKLTLCDVQDLFEVCQGLEALAGELAGERITDEEIDEVRRAHEAMVAYYKAGDLAGYYRCNRQIHEAIVAAARNPVLSGLYETVTARIRCARYLTPMTPPRWAVAISEHEGIFNSLSRRDSVGLAHILRAHLRHKREEVIKAGFADASSHDMLLTADD